MGLYRDRLLPHIVDKVCGTVELRRWRSEVAAGLSGVVVEVGFGSGLSLLAYPPDVQLVYAVEPADAARRLARRRIAASPIRVELVGLEAAALPLEDECCDGALSSFTLCTIPDVERALAEIRRVLRPGGRFHVLEHGLSPDEGVATWQRRLDPLQQRLGGGCHLTREPLHLVRSAGFEVVRTESRYVRGPRPWTWMTAGWAVRTT